VVDEQDCGVLRREALAGTAPAAPGLVDHLIHSQFLGDVSVLTFAMRYRIR
jgi:hypothetical protein